MTQPIPMSTKIPLRDIPDDPCVGHQEDLIDAILKDVEWLRTTKESTVLIIEEVEPLDYAQLHMAKAQPTGFWKRVRRVFGDG